MLEFALLAPVFIGLLMGVLEVGLYMQNYNAVHTLATDASRFVAVEYQKNNALTTGTMEDDIVNMGTGGAYNLSSDRLTADVQEVTPSPVDGAREFTLTLSYRLPPIAGSIALNAFTISDTRTIFVLST